MYLLFRCINILLHKTGIIQNIKRAVKNHYYNFTINIVSRNLRQNAQINLNAKWYLELSYILAGMTVFS